MELSFNQTSGHLKIIMARMKDVVFPLYSNVREEDALSEIFQNLVILTSEKTAEAFMGRIPEIRRLLDNYRKRVYNI